MCVPHSWQNSHWQGRARPLSWPSVFVPFDCLCPVCAWLRCSLWTGINLSFLTSLAFVVIFQTNVIIWPLIQVIKIKCYKVHWCVFLSMSISCGWSARWVFLSLSRVPQLPQAGLREFRYKCKDYIHLVGALFWQMTMIEVGSSIMEEIVGGTD